MLSLVVLFLQRQSTEDIFIKGTKLSFLIILIRYTVSFRAHNQNFIFEKTGGI